MHVVAVTAASGAAPAIAVSTPSGLRAMIESGTAISSAQLPACTTGVIAGTKPNTSAPTSSTTPAKSRPSVIGKTCSTMSLTMPATMALSMGLTAEARTRTRSSPGPGVGSGRPLRTTGGLPSSSKTTAFIRRMLGRRDD